MDIIGIVGGIASIIGAAIAIWQAIEAKNAASEAKKTEKNITHHRLTSDVSKLKEKAESLLSQIKIYAPGGNQAKYQYADHDNNSELIQEFTLKVSEFISCFSGKQKTEIQALCSDIDNELNTFNTPGITDPNRKSSGQKIVGKVNMLNSKFKQVLDKRVEKGT